MYLQLPAFRLHPLLLNIIFSSQHSTTIFSYLNGASKCLHHGLLLQIHAVNRQVTHRHSSIPLSAKAQAPHPTALVSCSPTWGQAQACPRALAAPSLNSRLRANATSSRDPRTLPHHVPPLFLTVSSWHFQPHVIIYSLFIVSLPHRR